jgi:hypothetical protein
MTCEAYEALIALHVDGDLPTEEAVGLDAHLAACASCQSFAGVLREGQAALRDLGQEDVDAAALAAVRWRVTQSLDEARPARRFAPVWAFPAAAAVAALAVLLLGRRPERSAETPPVAQGPAVASAPPSLPAPPAAPAGRAPVAPRRAVARAGARPVAPRAAPARIERQSDLVIKLVTSDPDIVIYWLVDQNGGKS